MKKIKFFEKQGKVWNMLTLPKYNYITELLIWWWGGWSKSFTWCLWTIIMWLQYPWIHIWLWRSDIKNLKQTTLTSFFEVIDKLWLDRDEIKIQLDPDTKTEVIYFKSTWSRAYLIDLKHYPVKDPEFTKLWSLLLTIAFVDEIWEITKKAYEILQTRVWRWMNDEYDIPAKILSSCNPVKNRVYRYFYKRWRDKRLPNHITYVPVLAKDNPFCPQAYKITLDRLPHWATRMRLRDWNRDYDDSPDKLYDYDDLLDMWTNPINHWDWYISCDVAREWKDKAVIMVWHWWEVVEVVVFDKCKLDVLKKEIVKLSQKYKINMSRVIVDADWMWAWIVDDLKCKPFHNNASPIQTKEEEMLWVKPNYQNLKTQCYFKFQDHVRETRFHDERIKDDLVEELDVVKEINLDKDNQKRRITPKEEVKEIIGRSPDLADTTIMRCYFALDVPLKHVVF